MPLVLQTDTNPGNAQWLPAGATDPTLADFSFYQPGVVPAPTIAVPGPIPIGDPAVVVPVLGAPPTGLVWWYEASYTGVFTNSAVAPAATTVSLFIDGAPAGVETTAVISTSATGIPESLPLVFGAALTPLASHTFDIFWAHSGLGSGDGVTTLRSLLVRAYLKRI